MIRSMTGYGNAVKEKDGLVIRAEIKSLNSRGLDLSVRLPKNFSAEEINLRSKLTPILNRGKVSIYVDTEPIQGKDSSSILNKELLLKYYKELKDIAGDLGADSAQVFSSIIQLPQILNGNSEDGPNPLLWPIAAAAIEEALTKFNQFRDDEGNSLAKELEMYVRKIKENLDSVAQLKDTRLVRIKEALLEKLQGLIGENRLDAFRLEQEMIFYAEKLDITEEIVRLNTHIQYFLDTMKEDSPGKKLSFISQEMGREINTIGSKSNDVAIQKSVVTMKDELEKIKEQVLNVL